MKGKEKEQSLLNWMKSGHPEWFKETYSRQELLEVLLSLQDELIAQLPENTCKVKRITDVVDVFRCNAKRREMLEEKDISDLLEEVSCGLDEMQRLISSTISGLNGEKRVLNELKLIDSMDIEIIPNVSLFIDNYRCEIDYVVITNYGIYCVEVKTPSSDMFIDKRGYLIPTKIDNPKRGRKNNILHQCRVQQHVLKQYLGADKRITALVVCGNWDTDIYQENKSGYIETLGLGSLVERIQEDTEVMDFRYGTTEISTMARMIKNA